MKRGLFVLSLAMGMTGCAVLGRQQKDQPITLEAVQKVQKGMSKEEVTSILGAPQEILFSNKQLDPLREHAYIYEHIVTCYTGIVFVFVNFGNSDEKRDRVIVFFDESGKVANVGASLQSENAIYGFPFGR